MQLWAQGLQLRFLSYFSCGPLPFLQFSPLSSPATPPIPRELMGPHPPPHHPHSHPLDTPEPIQIRNTISCADIGGVRGMARKGKGYAGPAPASGGAGGCGSTGCACMRPSGKASGGGVPVRMFAIERSIWGKTEKPDFLQNAAIWWLRSCQSPRQFCLVCRNCLQGSPLNFSWPWHGRMGHDGPSTWAMGHGPWAGPWAMGHGCTYGPYTGHQWPIWPI